MNLRTLTRRAAPLCLAGVAGVALAGPIQERN